MMDGKDLKGNDDRGPLEAGTSAAHADDAAGDVPAAPRPGDDAGARADKLLDEAVEETFPASDPISPSGPRDD